jgi:hypothetical protein
LATKRVKVKPGQKKTIRAPGGGKVEVEVKRPKKKQRLSGFGVALRKQKGGGCHTETADPEWGSRDDLRLPPK